MKISDKNADRLSTAIVVAVATLLVLVSIVMIQGCSCKPRIIRVIERVPSAPEVITIMPPLLKIQPMPTLESIDNAALAAVDPAAWLRLLASDLIEMVDAVDRMRGEMIAANATRK